MNPQTNLFDPPPFKSFHNTTDLSGRELVERNHRCGKQEIDILKAFQKRGPQFDANAFEVSNFPEVNLILDSVKRALSNLKYSGYLRFSGARRKGRFSDMNKCFELTTKGKNYVP